MENMLFEATYFFEIPVKLFVCIIYIIRLYLFNWLYIFQNCASYYRCFTDLVHAVKWKYDIIIIMLPDDMINNTNFEKFKLDYFLDYYLIWSVYYSTVNFRPIIY